MTRFRQRKINLDDDFVQWCGEHYPDVELSTILNELAQAFRLASSEEINERVHEAIQHVKEKL